MAAGTYIKFITSNGTVLTGAAATQWGEAVDPGYAQTLEAELESDQGGGVPTIQMPILDSGLAAAVDAAAASGTLQIEVAGYDDQGRLTNDIVLGARGTLGTTVGSETVTTDDSTGTLAQTLSVQPPLYLSRTTSYDASGTATTTPHGYNFQTGTSLRAPANAFSAPADPTSIASAATADAGVTPVDTDYLVIETTGNTVLEPSKGTGITAPTIPPDTPYVGDPVDLIETFGFTSNLTNSSGSASASIAFSVSAGAESPALFSAFFDGDVLDSISSFQVSGSGGNLLQSATTFDAMTITNVDISLSAQVDARTYQLQSAQPGARQDSTYTVHHWTPSGSEATQTLTLGAGTPGVDQVSTTARAGIAANHVYTFGIGSGSSAASYALDGAEISFSRTSTNVDYTPLTLTFANAADASAAAADFAAGGQTINIQQGKTDGTGGTNYADTLTFRTAGAQVVSDVMLNADGSETFNVDVAAFQEQFSGVQQDGGMVQSNTFVWSKVTNKDGTSSFAETACYLAGTLIRTIQGDVSVEDLAVGDRVVTASGEVRPIRWLGHRTIDCRRHPRPHEAHPVRIAAHAFGPDRPARDLYVSPGHAVCVDVLGEVLVPARVLVNGTTISQVEVDAVTYWHAELDRHDILLAENLPAESYIDCGNRSFFVEAEVVGLAAGPDTPAASTEAYCRPFHCTGAPVDIVRAPLADLGREAAAAGARGQG